MSNLINIGEGRIVEWVEIKDLPPPPYVKPNLTDDVKPRVNQRYVRKKRTLRKGFVDPCGGQGDKGKRRRSHIDIPGYADWISRRTIQLDSVNPVEKHKSRFGIPCGMLRADANKVWARSAELARRDIARMKDAGILKPEDTHAEEAMTATLEIMRSPMDQKMKLAAARQVLEWTKAKPASSSNVTVASAEDWLDSLNTKE